MRGRPPTGWRAPGAIGLATLPSRSGDQDGRHRIWATDAQIRCELCSNPGAIFAQFNLTKHTARTSPSGPGHPSGPMALREGARPQDPRDRPCDPSPSRPSRARRVPPRLGHAPGPPPALPSPSGTRARRGPVSLPLSPRARPPRPSRYHARHPASPLDMSSRGQHRGGDAVRRHADGGLTESWSKIPAVVPIYTFLSVAVLTLF